MSRVEWRIERAENGTPLRMYWIPAEEAEEIERLETERVEKNRTLRYVEPCPFVLPGFAREEAKP